MIPQRRQDLVPEIRAPRHADAAAQKTQRSRAAVTLERHPLRPTLHQLSSVRLLSFIAAPECGSAPAKLIVTPTAERTSAASNAPNADVAERVSDGVVSDGEEGGTGAAAPAPRREEQRRTRAARRVHYTAHRQRPDAGGGDVVRLSSLPIVEYEHLDCLLLVPSTAGAAGSGPQAGTAAAAVGASCSLSYDVAVLPCPLLELRCDRAEAARVAGGSISASWLPERSTRFNKKDWRSMDALDVAEGKRGRWEAEEAEGAAEEAESGGTKRNAMRARRPRNHAELQSYNPVMPSARVQDTSSNASLALANACGSASYDASMTLAPTAPAVAAQLSSNAPTLLAVSGADEEKMPAPSSAPQQRMRTLSLAAAPVTLDVCALGVLRELHHAGRTTAPLKELEKLILKRLPSYAGMAAKTKAEDTKVEAIKWLREAQAALRRWLLEHGHTIDSSGNVFFVIEG